jgi:putative ABC transport system substrate-binding protein
MMRDDVTAAALLSLALLVLLASTGDSWAQSKVLRVGVLARPLVVGTTPDVAHERFVQTLAQQGWSETKNVRFEYRSAQGTPPDYDASAEELVKLKVDVIYANNAPATRAAFKATRVIPIVGIDHTNDPVAAGYAKSYGRPGRNLTGFFLDAPGFAGKWLEQLKALIPGLSRVAVVWDPSPGNTHLKAIERAVRSQGLELQVLEVRTPKDIAPAFAKLRERPQALLILPSPMTWAQSERLAQLALKHRLPATSMAAVFAEAGGLLSYGPDRDETVDRCAILVSQILRGANPGDLPLERPTKLPLTINLKTAKALGLTVPAPLLVSADKVIR